MLGRGSVAERAKLCMCGFLPQIPITVLRKCHSLLKMVMRNGDDLEGASVGKGEAAGK